MGDFLSALGALAGGAAPGIERGMARRRERRAGETRKREAEAKKGESFQDWMRKFGIQQEAKKEMFGLQQEAKMEQFGIQQEAKRRQAQEAKAAQQTSLNRFLEMAGVDPAQAEQNPELAMQIAAEQAAGGDGTKSVLQYGMGVAAQRKAEEQARAQAEAAGAKVPLPPEAGPELGPGPPEPTDIPTMPLPAQPQDLQAARVNVERWEEETGQTVEELSQSEVADVYERFARQGVLPGWMLGGEYEAGPGKRVKGARELRHAMAIIRDYRALQESEAKTGRPWERPSKAVREKHRAEHGAVTTHIRAKAERQAAVEKREMAETSLEQRKQQFAAAYSSGTLTAEDAAEKYLPEGVEPLRHMERIREEFRGQSLRQVVLLFSDPRRSKALEAKLGTSLREIKLVAMAGFSQAEKDAFEEEQEQAEKKRAKKG